MDLRDFGYVDLPDSKEEEIKWREQEEQKLISLENKLGKSLTTPPEQLSTQTKSIQ